MKVKINVCVAYSKFDPILISTTIGRTHPTSDVAELLGGRRPGHHRWAAEGAARLLEADSALVRGLDVDFDEAVAVVELGVRLDGAPVVGAVGGSGGGGCGCGCGSGRGC